MALYKLVFNL